jgi:hypothetical protein
MARSKKRADSTMKSQRWFSFKTKSGFLLTGLLLIQMLGWPNSALCADRKAVTEATVDTVINHADSTAFVDSVKSPEKSALLAFSDFNGCDSRFGAFNDHANNYIQPDPVGGKGCVAGIGANHVTYGKLMTHQFPVSRDVWISGYVFFPVNFQLPAVAATPNGVCYGGVHLWRLHESLTNSSNRISMDFNVPAGLDVIQFYVIRDNGAKSFTKWTTYKPAKLKGQWQYWQVHVNLGTPGKSDGFLRFYADHRLVDSMERQSFLPNEADATWGFSYADMQSNIGGCSLQWPVQNGWLVSDVRVCNGDLC